jgi:hypothetical protein
VSSWSTGQSANLPLGEVWRRWCCLPCARAKLRISPRKIPSATKAAVLPGCRSNRRNARVSGGRCSDVLYQGTTSVGPYRPTRIWALAPGLLHRQVSVAVRVCSAGAEAQFSFSLFTARLKSCPDTKPRIRSSFSCRNIIQIETLKAVPFKFMDDENAPPQQPWPRCGHPSPSSHLPGLRRVPG